ncbi:MAG: hypothetical protein O3B41_10240 [Bacteroidetes bacterium]|nr:hypothetical protein [Bacteroidota bacterium]
MIPTSNIRPTVVRDLDVARERWNNLNAVNIASSPFTEFTFAERLAEIFGWTLVPVFWGDVLGVCFVVRSRAWTKDAVVPPFAPFSCIALSESVPILDRVPLLHRLFEDIPSIPFSRVYSFDPRLCITGISPTGYQLAEKQTYVVQTAPLNQAMTSFSEGTKRHFNRSKDDYSFQIDRLPLSTLCELVSDGYRHHNQSAPLQTTQLENLATEMGELPFARKMGLFSAETVELHAGMVLLCSQEKAWYWLVGSKRGPAMTVLLANAIHYLHEQNIPSFDLMGANTDGITEFKRRFGGDLVSYSHWIRTDGSNRLLSKMGLLIRSLRRF